MWKIRTAKEEDIKSLVKQLGTRMNEKRKAAFLDKVERYVRKPDRTLFIALSPESRITGFSCIIELADVPEFLPDRVAGLLRKSALSTGLLVHPDHRKKGIGTALFRRLEQWAVNRGRAGNWLVTHGKSHWYRRDFGYEEVGQILSKGVEKTIMAKKFENRRLVYHAFS